MAFEKETGGGVNALARGLELLRCFTPNSTELSNGELAERTGLPKSTVSRLTKTLTELGYLRHDAARRAYRVGPSVLALGYAALGNLRLRDKARPSMQEFADATGALVSLATRERLAMIYIESCRSRSSMTLRVGVGTQLPIFPTSIGRAFLAGLPASERMYLVHELSQRDPGAWAVQRLGVERELARFAQHGYCLSIGEWKKDVNAAAVPVVTADSSDLMVLSASGPAYAVTASRLEEDIAPRLVALARHLEAIEREGLAPD
ncbi:MAG TPA: IclR family transcriptional regulator [Rhodocyclaceae bacterium]